MAPSSRPSPGRRVSGQLVAEVALAILLLGALALAWPAGPQTDPTRDTALAIGSSAGSGRASGDRTAEDMAPPRTKPVTPTFPQLAPTPPPVQLLVSSLNLHPRVESVGLDRSGAMAVPRNYFDVGWYNGGPVPGDPGDAVIDGHAGYPDQPLIFAKLVKFRPGDKIVVVLADGSRRDFMVDSVRSWPARAHPTGLFDPYGPARLSLITCTGQFNDKRNTYADRLVVEAHFLGIEGEAFTS